MDEFPVAETLRNVLVDRQHFFLKLELTIAPMQKMTMYLTKESINRGRCSKSSLSAKASISLSASRMMSYMLGAELENESRSGSGPAVCSQFPFRISAHAARGLIGRVELFEKASIVKDANLPFTSASAR